MDDVLLIEDNVRDATTALATLERNHVTNTLTVVHDGAQAMTRLFGPERIEPVLILLDLHLPRVDGVRLLDHLRADPRTRHIPVILLAPEGQELDLELRARSHDHTVCINKPVDFSSLVAAARAVGVTWRVRAMAETT